MKVLELPRSTVPDAGDREFIAHCAGAAMVLAVFEEYVRLGGHIDHDVMEQAERRVMAAQRGPNPLASERVATIAARLLDRTEEPYPAGA